MRYTYFETETGSLYKIRDGENGREIRRIAGAKEGSLRGDAQWLYVHEMYPEEPLVGQRVLLTLEPLSPEAKNTHRTTTIVMDVWEEEGEDSE